MPRSEATTDSRTPNGQKRLDLHYVHILGADGRVTECANVLCWRTGHTASLTRCQKCVALTEVSLDKARSSSYVACIGPTDSPGEGGQPLGRVFPAARAPVWSLMKRTVMAICPDVPLSTVASLLVRTDVTSAPVVDPAGRLLGILSRGDFVEPPPPPDATGREATASAIMRKVPIHVYETAPITQASAVMAIHGLASITVVDESLRVVGVLDSLDVLRWLASQDGYLDPPPRADEARGALP